MMVQYVTLAQRIRQEIKDIERVVTAAQRHWQGFQAEADDQDVYLNSVALNLHSFYTGLERVFELIATELDGGTLGKDEAWHVNLLRQMTLELPGVRPAVLRQGTESQLNEYRRFRHLIRNIYTTALDPKRMIHLIDALPQVWQQVGQELAAFNTFLADLSRADEE